MQTVVFKLGGSLLDLPDLPSRLQAVLDQFADCRPLLIVGGGPAADVVREWDALHTLGNEAAHWLAIEAMSLGERLVNLILPDSRIIGQHRGAEHAWENNQIPILQASNSLRDQKGNASSKLPASWDVTSDSIAAWVTIHWPADELVLLKSCDYNEDNPDVDPHFPLLAGEIPKISWANLRNETPQIQSCKLR